MWSVYGFAPKFSAIDYITAGLPTMANERFISLRCHCKKLKLNARSDGARKSISLGCLFTHAKNAPRKKRSYLLRFTQRIMQVWMSLKDYWKSLPSARRRWRWCRRWWCWRPSGETSRLQKEVRVVFLVVWETWSSGYGRRLKVVGSNPGAVYWMDMTFFTLICCKNGIVCLKRSKIN